MRSKARYGADTAKTVMQKLMDGIRQTMTTLRQFFFRPEEGAEYGQPPTESQTWVTNLEQIHGTLAQMYAQRFGEDGWPDRRTAGTTPSRSAAAAACRDHAATGNAGERVPTRDLRRPRGAEPIPTTSKSDVPVVDENRAVAGEVVQPHDRDPTAEGAARRPRHGRASPGEGARRRHRPAGRRGARDDQRRADRRPEGSRQLPKGRVSFHGLPFVMENPKDSTRSGVDADGKPWEAKLPADYGYLSRTEGADGDQVDAYIGPRQGASQQGLGGRPDRPEDGAPG